MKIVAIGGGEKTKAVTHALDLTGAEKPHVLINPSSASTKESYSRKVPMITEYFHELGVSTSVLHDYEMIPSAQRIDHELGRASMIYTLGGNSPYMLRIMRCHGSDLAIRRAIESGVVHAGTSAGALLPFELAHSNIAKRPAEEKWDYKYLKALGIIPGVATAHANQHDPTPSGLRKESRLEALAANFPGHATIGYAIDNDAAISFEAEGVTSVIRAKPEANAYLLHRSVNNLSVKIERM